MPCRPQWLPPCSHSSPLMVPSPRAAAGRAFIATNSDGAVRMAQSSLPPAYRLSLPRPRRLWLHQLRWCAVLACAGTRASVAALFSDSKSPNLFQLNSELRLSAELFLLPARANMKQLDARSNSRFEATPDRR